MPEHRIRPVDMQTWLKNISKIHHDDDDDEDGDGDDESADVDGDADNNEIEVLATCLPNNKNGLKEIEAQPQFIDLVMDTDCTLLLSLPSTLLLSLLFFLSLYFAILSAYICLRS